MLSYQLSLKQEAGSAVSANEKRLLAQLSLGTYGTDSLKELEELFDSVDLSIAIQKGLLWALQDHQAFLRCNLGMKDWKLEEHAETKGGYQLVQGDMVALDAGLPLSPMLPESGSLMEAEQPAEAQHAHRGRPATKWHSGTVKYCVQEGTAPESTRAFLAATTHISEQAPCVNFEEIATGNKGCNELPSVILTSAEPGCWSFVGQIDNLGESQTLNLGVGCETMGMAAHQLMHTLGFVHQTSRADRDNYVRIVEANADPTVPYAVHFVANDEQYEKTTFDYLSIMNLSPFAFSADGKKPTITTKNDPRLTAFFGQRMGLSQIDAEHVCEIYGCYREVKPHTQSRKLSENFLEGKGYDDGMCQDEKYTGMSYEGKLATCAVVAKAGLCQEPEYREHIVAKCPVSCMTCVPGLIDIKYTKSAKPEKAADTKLAAVSDKMKAAERAPQGGDIFVQRHSIDADTASRILGANTATSQTTGGLSPNKSGGKDGVLDITNLAVQDLHVHAHEVHELVPKSAAPPPPVSTVSFGTWVESAVKKQTSRGSAKLPGAVCEDATNTGIKVRFGGQQASCEELRNYCGHETIGKRVTDTCKRTCGQCEIVSMRSGCSDKGAFDEPMYQVGGVFADCKDLLTFCSFDRKIKEKCATTCGACPVDLSRFDGHPTPQPTTNLYPRLPVNVTQLAEETGCSRRRSFGYCTQRRRRALASAMGE